MTGLVLIVKVLAIGLFPQCEHEWIFADVTSAITQSRKGPK